MSKLIVEMEMPKDCPMCPLAHYNKLDEFTGCEVAPFKRYAVKTDKAYAESDCRPDWCPIKGELHDKHGEWIEVHDWLQIPQEESGTYRCSACGQVMKYPWNYCPDCGAYMKGARG